MHAVRKDTAERLKNEIVEVAREEAEVHADKTRREVGDVVFDKMGEYFPEAVEKRRRRHIASGFVVGVLVGFLARYAIGER